MNHLAYSLKRWGTMPWASRTSPSQLALGVTLGLTLGLFPKDNLTFALMFLSLLYLPANIGMVLICFPFGFLAGPFTDHLAGPIGNFALQNSSARALHVWIFNQPLLPWFGLHNSIVMGTLLILVPVAPFQYLVSREAFRSIRRLMIQHHIDGMVLEAIRYKKAIGLLQRRRTRQEPDSSKLTDPSITKELEITPPSSPVREILEPDRPEDGSRLRIDHTPSGPILGSKHSEGAADRSSVFVGASGDHREISATSTRPLQENYVRPGLRIDSPSSLSSEFELPEVEGSIPPTPAMSIQLGDVLRETLIEVVRYHPHGNVTPTVHASLNATDPSGERARNGSEVPSMETSRSSPLIPGQLNVAPDGRSHSSMETHYPMHLHSRSNASSTLVKDSSSDAEPQREPESAKPNTVVPQPAEESLRYLLWHLSSLNREQKQ